MRVIATNIFDFTTWYKFGTKYVSKELIFDLSKKDLSPEELLMKTGFFEEEYEVFYLELNEENIQFDNEIINISLYDIKYIIPISNTGGQLLQNKLPDFKVFLPLDEDVYNKLISARNLAMSLQGLERVFKAFKWEFKSEYDKLKGDFTHSLLKYKYDLNSELDTIIDYIIFYERSKPYPLTDLGFFFDVGSVIRSFFHISDEDIKEKNVLKESDVEKYQLIDQIIKLSQVLQKSRSIHVWTEFIQNYEATPELQALNESLVFDDELKGLNNLLVIALYFKFRYMIRNTRSLDDNTFLEFIKKVVANVPEEAKVALMFNGLFFGGLRFKELQYKFMPLDIARYTNTSVLSKSEAKPIDSKNISKPQKNLFAEEVVQATSNQKAVLADGEDEITLAQNDNGKEFLLEKINSILLKQHTDLQKRVKKILVEIIESESTSHLIDLFLLKLRKEVGNKRVKKETAKITEEFVNQVQALLK